MILYSPHAEGGKLYSSMIKYYINENCRCMRESDDRIIHLLQIENN